MSKEIEKKFKESIMGEGKMASLIREVIKAFDFMQNQELTDELMNTISEYTIAFARKNKKDNAFAVDEEQLYAIFKAVVVDKKTAKDLESVNEPKKEKAKEVVEDENDNEVENDGEDQDEMELDELPKTEKPKSKRGRKPKIETPLNEIVEKTKETISQLKNEIVIDGPDVEEQENESEEIRWF